MTPTVLAVVFMGVLGHLVSAADPQLKDFSEASSDFGQVLHLKLSRDPKESNVLSAFSTHASLSMLSLGARNDTAEEMDRALNLTSFSDFDTHELYQRIIREASDDNVEVVTVMLINSDKPIEQEFKVAAESKYLAKIETFKPSEPEPEKKINEYVSEKTDGTIKELIKKGSINDKTSLVVASTIRINGTWQSAFDESKTTKQEFTCENGKKVQVDMMNSTRIVLYKSDNESDADVIQMPLKNGRHVIYFALPRRVNGLAALQERLSKPGNLKKLLEGLQPTTVEVVIPKIKTESRFELKGSLREMGMEKAFDANAADFSGISQSELLHLSEIVHAAAFQIDERGIRASAASVSETEDRFRPSKDELAQVIFKANHGFLYWFMNFESSQIYVRGLYNGEKKQ